MPPSPHHNAKGSNVDFLVCWHKLDFPCCHSNHREPRGAFTINLRGKEYTKKAILLDCPCDSRTDRGFATLFFRQIAKALHLTPTVITGTAQPSFLQTQCPNMLYELELNEICHCWVRYVCQMKGLVGDDLYFSQHSIVLYSLLKYLVNWQIRCRNSSLLCILYIKFDCSSRICGISLRNPLSNHNCVDSNSSSWERINQVFVTMFDAYRNYWCSQIPSMCTLNTNGPLISSLVTRQSQISLRRTSHRFFPGNDGKWCLRMF